MDMQINSLTEAFKFMLLGMGAVFLFLVFLIFVLKIQYKIIKAFSKEIQPSTANTNQATSVNTNQSNKKIAAIVGAVEQFNKR